MLRSILIVSMIAGSIILWGSTPSQALSVDFGTPSIEVATGSDFYVDIFADIGEDEQVLGWDIDLIFDPSQISFLGFTLNENIWNPATPYGDDDVSMAAGLAMFGLPLGTGIYGQDILLATVFLECLAPGTSVLDISTDDPGYEGFIPPYGEFLSFDSTPMTIVQTPEPSAILFMIISMFVVAGLHKVFPGKKA